ncbi:hypothetical protein OJAV_G00109730 [Oryzias javanicus]|uniref:Sodium channel regulatory subunit beta-1 n=1 Tax=Oryzias javanicus TaxID=123683 RepID=A0A437CW61_ORYJA|nr:hypothetical protein OJAV_G00109730 [Oryzias javanicus]
MAPVHLLLLALLCPLIDRGDGACAEVDSDTEAVAGRGFKLGCISCKRRSEVEGFATVEWYFRPTGESDFIQIYSYNEGVATIEHDDFSERIDWNGSKRSNDIQDASIYLLNVVHLTVVAKATRGTASIVSEVMMYVSIIGLQLWLLIEMIYCYRKIAAAGEEALREAANAEYLAIASESKDNCAGVQVGE